MKLKVETRSKMNSVTSQQLEVVKKEFNAVVNEGVLRNTKNVLRP